MKPAARRKHFSHFPWKHYHNNGVSYESAFVAALPAHVDAQARLSGCCKEPAMPDNQDSKANPLMAVLPEDEWARLAPHLVEVDMPLGQVVYESGGHLEHVYFPTTSIVSLLYVMENGASAEIAIVGREGIVGIARFMGGETTPSRAIVQSGGHAYRLSARVLKEEFSRGGPVQRLLLCYTQALITQMAQTAVCNRHHSIDQQLCRWLLLSIGGWLFNAPHRVCGDPVCTSARYRTGCGAGRTFRPSHGQRRCNFTALKRHSNALSITSDCPACRGHFRLDQASPNGFPFLADGACVFVARWFCNQYAALFKPSVCQS
jgi:CRP-like cAMP-binding protein